MDQQKFGNFISELRKNKKLTQQELAKKLGVTDKAVSKWERGLACPDISLLIPLGDILGVTINELLLGERIKNSNNLRSVDNFNKKIIEYSNNEISLSKHKNKRLKILLAVIGIILVAIILFVLINYYTYEKEIKNLNNYINNIEKNLRDLNFKKDNPLHTPNFILTIDGITYVVPRIIYKPNNGEIYKDILSYADYENFTGLIVYYNGKDFNIYEYKHVGSKKTDIISIDCDLYGNLVSSNNYTKDQKDLYDNNKDEIEKRIYDIRMMWINIYEY